MVITASLREHLRRGDRLDPSPRDARLLARSMLRPGTTVHNGRGYCRRGITARSGAHLAKPAVARSRLRHSPSLERDPCPGMLCAVPRGGEARDGRLSGLAWPDARDGSIRALRPPPL